MPQYRPFVVERDYVGRDIRKVWPSDKPGLGDGDMYMYRRLRSAADANSSVAGYIARTFTIW